MSIGHSAVAVRARTGSLLSVSKVVLALVLAAVMGSLPSGVSPAENSNTRFRAESGDRASLPWGFEAPYWPDMDSGTGVREIHGVLALGETRTVLADHVGFDAPGITPEAQAGPREIVPRALAMEDYDEDGVPDLVVAQATPEGGRLVLYRGNPAALFPRSAPAERMRELGTFTRAPFLSPARVFDSALAPDFLGTGDFDNDGHRDVVAGAWGARHLATWLGDGHGGLSPGPDIPLAGALTAAAVGEVHRPDGLADLAVAVDGGEGAQLAVFNGPDGVLNATPEVMPLPYPATAIVLERLDDDPLTDLAVAAGSELIVLKGRNRTYAGRSGLPHDAATADTEPASLSLPFEILAMTSGNFLEDARYRPELALLAADGAIHALPRSIFADLAPGRVGIVESESLPVIATAGAGATGLVSVRGSNTPTHDLLLLGEPGEAAELLVTQPATGSSRHEFPDTETGSALRHPLPESSGTVAAVTARLSVDAYDDLVLLRAGQSEPSVQFLEAPLGGGGSFLVNDTSVFTLGPVDGICDIDSMTMGDQCNLAEALNEAANFTSGTVTIEFAGDGPYQSPGQNSITVPLTIDGGASGGDPNVQIILNSTLGLDAAPSVIRGVRIIGAILVFRENNGNNLFENNWVGLDASGTAVINVNAGLTINTNNAQTTFGGASPGAGNVIAARSIVNSFSDGDVFRGNKIGTGKNGTLSLGTQPGTVLSIQGPSALVGGTGVGDGNLISGNQFAVGLRVISTDALVQGNLIGTDASGTTALGNGSAGVVVAGVGGMVTIGGTAVGAGNVISANSFPSDFYGLAITTTGTVTVQGNIIGGDITGTVGLGNRGVGISLQSGGHIIGGTTGSAANTIVDSQAVAGDPRFVGNGIEIPLAGASNNLIQGNRIGVGLLLTPLGNQGHGIIVTSSAADNLIGGMDAGAGNEIRYNDGTGVLVSGNAGQGNRILGNEIGSNGGLGIDLSVVSGPDGPTANDPGDGDGGPNGLQNYPVIDMVDPVAGNLEGSLASMPNTTYRLEVFANAACDPSGFGEGGAFLSATEVITDGNGDADFILNQGGLNNPTLTATDTATGNTSEFSACFPAEAPASVVNSVGDDPDDDIGDGDCDTGGMIDREGMPEPECTLRAALEEQLPQILFDIPQDQYPPTGAPLIQPTSAYPIIDYPVIVDAGSQPGVGVVQVDFGQSGAGGPSPNSQEGISGGLCPNPGVGFQIAATNVQVLPGMALFCYSDYGVWLSGSFSTLEGVKIGTDFEDTAGLGGSVGVLIKDEGQGQPGEDHNQVINSEIVDNTTGIKIEGGASQGNELSGNFIGTTAAGLTDLGNGTGVLISNAGGNFIDDNTIVHGLLAGVVLEDSGDGTTTTGNQVTGNAIGTNNLGGSDLGNGTNGVWIHNARGNFIGGDGPFEGNLISGNGDFTPDSETGGGILLQGHNTRGNSIQGNFIGTTPDGLGALGNAQYGIAFDAADVNTIGGPTENERNVISGNVGNGVQIVGNGIADGTAPDNPLGQVIQGNYIGTDKDGLQEVGNGKDGILISNSAGNLIGAADFASGGNLISGNDDDGVHVIQGPMGTYFRNDIKGNGIGTDVNDLFGLPNQGHGIRLESDDTLVDRNRIAHNAKSGVFVDELNDGNRISRNWMSSNAELGIDLEGGVEDGFGVTANDPGDTLPGANRLTNYPVIQEMIVAPSVAGLMTTVRGSYDNGPDSEGFIEIFDSPECDPSGHGEGNKFQARDRKRANGRFLALISNLDPGFITATSSVYEEDRPLSHTSEFSACFDAPPPPAPGAYLVINEIDAVPSGQEFIELSSGGQGGVTLTETVLVFYDGADDLSYAAIDLDGHFTDADGFFVAGNAAVPEVGEIFADGLLLDGPAAMALYEGDDIAFPNGTPVTTDNLIDAVVYGPAGPPDAGLLVLLQPNQPQVDEAALGDASGDSAQRCPDSSGGARYTDTYEASPATPGDQNACVVCHIEPEQASAGEGQDVALTVTVLVDAITPTTGIDVDFDVESGPNAGEMASAVTDDFGEAMFSYTGLGGTGVDAVTASGMFDGVPFFCEASVNWSEVPILISGFE